LSGGDPRKRIRWYQRYTEVDGTFVKVGGQRAYLYCAIDKNGETIDFMLSPRRTAKSARHFLAKALKLRDDCPAETIEQRANEGSKQTEQALQAEGTAGLSF
jgi:transposase, IS6 family